MARPPRGGGARPRQQQAAVALCLLGLLAGHLAGVSGQAGSAAADPTPEDANCECACSPDGGPASLQRFYTRVAAFAECRPETVGAGRLPRFRPRARRAG